MTEHESERKRPRAPLPSQGVMALLERWVSNLERDDPFPRAEEAPAPAQEKDPTASIRAARKEIRLQGWGAILPPGDAQVVLAHEGDRLVHRGTVGVRGPCAPTRRELLELGWTEGQARALEFVLAWFGAPFDSLTWDPQGEGELRWGAWPLAGPALIEALGRWQRRDPSGFEARLGRLGVEVTSRSPPQPSSLTFLEVERGQRAEGRQALTLMGDDPRMFAALAQAGRERAAQLSQLEYVLEQLLRPALAYSRGGASSADSPDGPFSTPRSLALLLHAELRLGRRGVTRLVSHTRETAGQPGSGEQSGARFAEDLHTAGRTREAAEVRRILSSPELADGLT